MGRYSTKVTDDEGNTTWEASDGKSYKTKAGAWKHSKSIEVDGATVEPTIEPEVVMEEPEQPATDWLDFDQDYGEAPDHEIIPSPLKKLRPASKKRGKMSKKELEAIRETNTAILKIGYRSGDYFLTKYRRVMLEDPKCDPVTHSELDYEWISGITEEALADSGISIGAAIGPVQVATVANVYWFGAPIHRIHQESEKSPFTGRAGGAVGRLLERVPVLGKWIKNRRQPEYTIEDFGGEQNE